MPRYVDVEPFDVIAYETKGKEEWTEFDEGVSFILDKIDNAPTADVAPVVHGWWAETYEPIPWCNFDVSVFYTCSVCKRDHDEPSQFCPNCGAKMDGERRNDA